MLILEGAFHELPLYFYIFVISDSPLAIREDDSQVLFLGFLHNSFAQFLLHNNDRKDRIIQKFLSMIDI